MTIHGCLYPNLVLPNMFHPVFGKSFDVRRHNIIIISLKLDLVFFFLVNINKACKLQGQVQLSRGPTVLLQLVTRVWLCQGREQGISWKSTPSNSWKEAERSSPCYYFRSDVEKNPDRLLHELHIARKYVGKIRPLYKAKAITVVQFSGNTATG